MTLASIFFLILIYVPLILLWVFTLVNLSHREDLSGTAKGLWAVAIVLLPLIGMLIYFITRPDDAVTSENWDVVPGTVAPPRSPMTASRNLRSLRNSRTTALSPMRNTSR
jgi:hypothetical protein